MHFGEQRLEVVGLGRLVVGVPGRLRFADEEPRATTIGMTG